MLANDIYHKCMADPKFKCTRCTAKRFTISNDMDTNSELSRITELISCSDINLKCISNTDQGYVYTCVGDPNNTTNVTMICDDK